jgi:hypothetical protein
MLSLLTNKFVLGLLGVILIASGIGFMYWNMNRWKEKAAVLEVQLVSMTAARDLLVDVNKSLEDLEKTQEARRAEVENKLNEDDRSFFERGMK